MSAATTLLHEARAKIDAALAELEPVVVPMQVGLNVSGRPGQWPEFSKAVKYARQQGDTVSEAEVGAAAASGVTISSWIFNGPAFVNGKGTIGTINQATYAANLVAHFKKYGKGGTFWAGRADYGGLDAEILNEPSGNWFWTDNANYSAYVGLLKAVTDAFAANFPAAIRPRVLACWDKESWWKGIAAAGAKNYCSKVIVHPYGGYGPEAHLGNRKGVAQAHAESGKPVSVTEVGWPTAVGQPGTGDSEQTTEAAQAENITNFIQWARAQGYITTVMIFGSNDYGTNAWYGIQRADNSHKPSFAALAAA